MIERYKIICLFPVCRAFVNLACAGFSSDPRRTQMFLEGRKINTVELEGVLQEPRVRSMI